MAHKKVVCSCGRVITNCRCMGPKEVVVSPDPCTHNQKPLTAAQAMTVANNSLTVANSAITASHPATTGINLREENTFLTDRLQRMATAIGLTVDPRILSYDEWTAALIRYRQRQMRLGAQKFAMDFADELEREATSIQERDLIKRLRDRALNMGKG